MGGCRMNPPQKALWSLQVRISPNDKQEWTHTEKNIDPTPEQREERGLTPSRTNFPPGSTQAAGSAAAR